MSGNELGYALPGDADQQRDQTPRGYAVISLRACYATSGTDLGYAGTGRRARYAMASTHIQYATMPSTNTALSPTAGAMRCPVLTCPLSCYALARLCPVLT
eukprot:3011271-Rhodomonas_salina.4